MIFHYKYPITVKKADYDFLKSEEKPSKQCPIVLSVATVRKALTQ